MEKQIVGISYMFIFALDMDTQDMFAANLLGIIFFFLSCLLFISSNVVLKLVTYKISYITGSLHVLLR